MIGGEGFEMGGVHFKGHVRLELDIVAVLPEPLKDLGGPQPLGIKFVRGLVLSAIHPHDVVGVVFTWGLALGVDFALELEMVLVEGVGYGFVHVSHAFEKSGGILTLAEGG